MVDDLDRNSAGEPRHCPYAWAVFFHSSAQVSDKYCDPHEESASCRDRHEDLCDEGDCCAKHCLAPLSGLVENVLDGGSADAKGYRS